MKCAFALKSGMLLGLKLMKCAFAMKSDMLLGHIVSPKGVVIDPKKVMIIRKSLNTMDKKGAKQVCGLGKMAWSIAKVFGKCSNSSK